MPFRSSPRSFRTSLPSLQWWAGSAHWRKRLPKLPNLPGNQFVGQTFLSASLACVPRLCEPWEPCVGSTFFPNENSAHTARRRLLGSGEKRSLCHCPRLTEPCHTCKTGRQEGLPLETASRRSEKRNTPVPGRN